MILNMIRFNLDYDEIIMNIYNTAPKIESVIQSKNFVFYNIDIQK